MKSLTRSRCLFAALSIALVPLLGLETAGAAGTASYVSDAAAMDWPHWRGPELNGISREKNIVASWKPQVKDADGEIVGGGEGENVLWQREALGSRSTPIVMDGKLYMMVRAEPQTDREGEKVVCIDAATGETLWENRFNVFLSDVPNTRVGWSSLVGDPATGDVYALGVCDYFQCIDGETGETKWAHSLSEEFGMLNTYGGRTNFPIIHRNLVIISGIVIGWGEMAKPAHRFIAFDKRNGQPVWFEGTRLLPYDTTYSSAITTVLDGQPALVFGSGDGGVHALQPQTGQSIWKYDVSARGINTTPVVTDEGVVVCGHSEENIKGTAMGALFAIDGTKEGTIDEALWRHKEWFVGKSSPLVVDGRVYACEDKGTLFVADLETGEKVDEVKLGGPVRSSPLYADGKIYICTENTIWWTFEPTEEGVETVHRARMNAGGAYGSPIVSHGRMYMPTTRALYCIGQEGQEPQADPRPERAQPTPKSENPEPAHLQLAPVEVVMQPGEKLQFSVRLYNKLGQYLRTAEAGEVEFAIEGPGRIDSGGVYYTPEEKAHAPVDVTATLGDLSGEARIRVIPDLPWEFDFTSGDVPVTWVGMRYRHVAIDFDLWEALRSEDPKAANLYIYLTTDFVNGGRDELVYDDTTPRRVWTDLLRFFDLEGKVDSLEGAQEAFDGALNLLADRQVLADFQWKELDGGRPQLTVVRGPQRVEGNGVMCKVSTIPKGTRSQGWLGRDDLQNYTVQADLYGTSAPVATEGAPPKMPDIGVQAQRYRLELRGNEQALKVYSWIAHEIKYKKIPFQWEPHTWYTMKLRASVEQRDGEPVAVLKGKVWPRDSEEPAEWSIEWTDAPANAHGSPGMFGNATDAELFVDNVRITPNAPPAGGRAEASDGD